MSALFSPIELRGLKLKNRIMVSPMCQYSAFNGEATDWHFTHINSLALSGAAMFCIEATLSRTSAASRMAASASTTTPPKPC
jgi:2,4-dienoyl-CoA reductase-like NADH-dependent reductase (Old Yellow Enzyme family)